MARSGQRSAGLAAVAALLIPTVAWGQPVKAKKDVPKGAVEIEEITVTAQKREESLQEVPVSITAFTGTALEEKGVTNVAELTQAVPNLHVNETVGSRSSMIFQMRGLGRGDNILTLQNPIGLYVDGAYIAHISGTNLDLEDLERVEVLRGPQGTLYGRNTIGGAINLVTRKPTDERSISVSTQAGNFDQFKSRVTFNMPLVGQNGIFQSDALGTLSLRENVMYKSHNGYFRSTDNPHPTDLDDLNRIFTMTALRWQPLNDLTIDYSFEYHRYRNGTTASQLTYIYPGSAVDGGFFSLRPYLRPGRVDAVPNSDKILLPDNSLTRPRDDGNHRMHILTADWNVGPLGPLGNVTLKSIASYRLLFTQQAQDLDGSPLHLAEFYNPQRIEHWSEELQWVGTAPRIQYVAGLYYYEERGSEESTQIFFGGANSFHLKDDTKNKSYAPFGQLTWTPPILGDKLSVTGGIRYTQEQVHVDRHFRCVNVTTVVGGRPVNICDVGIFGLQDFDSSHGKAFGGSDSISPMGNVAYQWTDDVMTYFRVSRGFRSGGFNGRATNPIAASIPFDPEKALGYEVGFKTQWFDNRLRLNADGFYTDYTDQQVTVTRVSPTAGALFVVENAASSEIWGSEVEAAAVPLRGLEASLTYSFLSPKYTEFLQETQDASGNPVITDVSDSRKFTLTPEHTFTVGLTYTAPPMSHGTFSAHVDVYWQDRMFLNATGIRAIDQANYALVNGRMQLVGIPLAKGTLDLAVFGRNIFDRKYRSFGVDFGSGLGFAINTYGPPRTFGLELAYNFTAAPQAVAPPPPPVAQAAPPPPPAKKKIVLRSVHFDFDKATLKADAKPILDEAVQVLKQEGSVDIVVEGHTDSVGSEQYNLGLSRRRAETVRRYLVEHGIAASRITAEGMGEAKPIASNDTADGRAQNRRVELHVR